MSVETLKRAIMDNLFYIQGKDEFLATPHDYYMALAYTVRDRLLSRWMKTQHTYFAKDVKVVCYLCVEYLKGRHLRKNLVSIGLWDRAYQALQELGLDLYDLMEQEEEPGLGNGGLGRLAACFIDSLATLEFPAIAYGIRYEFGIFDQKIQDGWQVERPDKWLRFGNPWEIPRPEYVVEVKLGGHTQAYTDENGRYQVNWIPQRKVLGTPYDVLIPGYNTNTVNTLRLWSARASEEFNFQVFNAGDYTHAVANKTFSENISKVLYPNDNTPQGRELRLEQQYFFVSCSLQDIIRLYLFSHDNFDDFERHVAIHINDTHPSLAVVELMRLLVDEHQLDWERAWSITQNCCAYTNHTLLPEALEQWSVSLFDRLLPRHLEIIYEINHRFLEGVWSRYPGDVARVARLSLIQEGAEKQVRMAHLACLGSHAINGVAQLHTKLLQEQVFPDFYHLYPQKFRNKTNGVSPRRWLLLSNPKLALLITERIGKGWIKDLEELTHLEAFTEDEEFCQAWRQIKHENKHDLAEYILHENGIEVDADSLFDVQVKRVHEYKRQILHLLHIITLYNRIKQNPAIEILPRTFIFAGKAAPGYFMAKLVIKFIHAVAEVVNNDPDVGSRLKVVFLRNYCVSLAQRICPAAEISEQISTAGKEASGTGNMKLAMNGALTIGTLDGANIEIQQQVGAENFFLFGLTASEVLHLKAQSYNPWDYYNTNPELRLVIDRIASGYFWASQPDLFRPIVESLLIKDKYMVIADYQSYVDCQQRVSQAYRDTNKWTQMSILNVARMGKFSSDRTIREYCQDIWHIKPVKVQLEPYNSSAYVGKT
ncbi:MAG: glycogen/starch/alpha-glucan phosphorylase [Calothrix sp. MO_192.B10]|nr:glycogen/starch/alpha-glucan phosphorylase [Calothrix sp. MO_192.B10]